MPTCTSCGAEIIWAVTLSGRRIPLDSKSERRAILDPKAGQGTPDPVRMRVVETYVSHFATCPNADQHRKKAD
jgi:hypothetical protein